AIIVLLRIAALCPDGCFADGRGDMLKTAIVRDGTQFFVLILMIHNETIQTFLCELWEPELDGFFVLTLAEQVTSIECSKCPERIQIMTRKKIAIGTQQF